ncbi:hypothetical protein [Cellulophaga sp. Z1A5H]|uniref:hypothetical protein n=1 Tax=Cellulophaga sp. Z1A5H TaxID=2687291 RepID=UPI0013FDF40F|nr:hypothetical protein [Cellulophaga sp. Z1A5H]
MIKIIIFISVLVVCSSCISRLVRPALSGTIVDFNGNPIDSCLVGETVTDHNGNFYLKEIRKNYFFITEVLVMEAPPLFVREQISKANYTTTVFKNFNSRGGGAKKGTHWRLDTLHLKKENFKIDTTFLSQKWKVAATKNLDSLYIIKSNFMELCKLQHCSRIYDEYYKYSSDSYYNQSKNLPDSIVQKIIELDLSTTHSLAATKIIQYGDKTGKSTIRKANDTLTTIGKWNFKDDLLLFNSNFDELNGKYAVEENNYEYLLVIKVDE